MISLFLRIVYEEGSKYEHLFRSATICIVKNSQSQGFHIKRTDLPFSRLKRVSKMSREGNIEELYLLATKLTLLPHWSYSSYTGGTSAQRSSFNRIFLCSLLKIKLTSWLIDFGFLFNPRAPSAGCFVLLNLVVLKKLQKTVPRGLQDRKYYMPNREHKYIQLRDRHCWCCLIRQCLSCSEMALALLQPQLLTGLFF